jgi:hypothetical protein
MVGGDLTKADSWTTSLLTNREVLDVDQHSTGNRVAVSNEEITIWVAQSKENPKQYYVAAFNRSESSRSREFAWKDLGLGSASYRLRDLWEHKDLGQAAKLAVSLPSHASLLYAVQMDAGHKP